MQHRTRRVFAAAALTTAGVAAATVVGTPANAAPATFTAARAAAPHSGFGSGSGALRAPTAAAAKAASTRMAAAYGGYPLRVTTLTTNVVAPLQIAVRDPKHVYVADDAAGTLLRLGVKNPIAVAPQGDEIAGVDVSPDGTVAYTWGNTRAQKSYLTVLRKGQKRLTVNLGAFEKRYNPDGDVVYGAQTNNQCALDTIAKATQGPAKYPGQVDTHPYSVKAVKGGWVVAEAAGNDLLFVDTKGHIRVIAVLPPQGLKITSAIAKGLGLDPCAIGVVYNFEPVPTDVEQGRDGRLYVTTLPGGPEGDSPLPPRGSVWRIGLNGKGLVRLATGFAGATNLAITPSGRILVAEFFAGRISTIEHGRPAPVIDLPNVASVEFNCHAIYAGTSAPFGPNGPMGHGSVVKIDVRW